MQTYVIIYILIFQLEKDSKLLSLLIHIVHYLCLPGAVGMVIKICRMIFEYLQTHLASYNNVKLSEAIWH